MSLLPKLMPHDFRELVNELREVARRYHGHGCLRELIVGTVGKYITPGEDMGKKETAAVNKLIEVTQRKIKWHKVENIGQAMPDMVGINRHYSETMWIEAKQIERIPARSDTKPLKGKFENGQQAWGRSWNSFGGKHAVFLRVGNGSFDYYLLSVSHGDLEEKTWEELMADSLITKGLDNIVMFLEYWH